MAYTSEGLLVVVAIGSKPALWRSRWLAGPPRAGSPDRRSYNNLGVLELRKGNVDQAQAHFRTAMDLGCQLFEPAFNAGLLAFKLGEFQDSAELAQKVPPRLGSG